VADFNKYFWPPRRAGRLIAETGAIVGEKAPRFVQQPQRSPFNSANLVTIPSSKLLFWVVLTPIYVGDVVEEFVVVRPVGEIPLVEAEIVVRFFEPVIHPDT